MKKTHQSMINLKKILILIRIPQIEFKRIKNKEINILPSQFANLNKDDKI